MGHNRDEGKNLRNISAFVDTKATRKTVSGRSSMTLLHLPRNDICRR